MIRSIPHTLIAVSLLVCSSLNLLAASITGEHETWHSITLTFEGPQSSEKATPNPFTNYRLEAVFRKTGSSREYKVPGYFAADGNAAESGANSGNKWRVRFAPDEPGNWNYRVSFRKGSGIAISDEQGDSAGYMDGESGSFEITASTKQAPDLRSKGRLEVVGEDAKRRKAIVL